MSRVEGVWGREQGHRLGHARQAEQGGSVTVTTDGLLLQVWQQV